MYIKRIKYQYVNDVRFTSLQYLYNLITNFDEIYEIIMSLKNVIQSDLVTYTYSQQKF